jgi:hypothetical protein
MATGVLLDFKNMNASTYNDVLQSLNLDTNPPKGGIFHAAGTTPNGMRVFDIWESKASFETFLNERLSPIFKRLNIELPRVEYCDIHNVYVAQRTTLDKLATGTLVSAHR